MTEPGPRQDLLKKLAEDADLRKRFQADPVAVTEEYNLGLSEDEKATLASENWLEKTEDELLGIVQDVLRFFWF